MRKKATGKLVHLGIKVPEEEKAKWEALAAKDTRSLSKWCYLKIKNAVQLENPQ